MKRVFIFLFCPLSSSSGHILPKKSCCRAIKECICDRSRVSKASHWAYIRYMFVYSRVGLLFITTQSSWKQYYNLINVLSLCNRKQPQSLHFLERTKSSIYFKGSYIMNGGPEAEISGKSQSSHLC